MTDNSNEKLHPGTSHKGEGVVDPDLRTHHVNTATNVYLPADDHYEPPCYDSGDPLNEKIIENAPNVAPLESGDNHCHGACVPIPPAGDHVGDKHGTFSCPREHGGKLN